MRKGDTVKKKELTPHDELVQLRQRRSNVETKLALINEPLLVDALTYELLGIETRIRFLIASEKKEIGVK